MSATTKFIKELARELEQARVSIVHKRRNNRMRLRVSFDDLTYFEGENLMTTFPELKKATISLKATTASGKPAKLDGIPEWLNSTPLAADLAVAADGLSATLSHLDEGSGQIKVTGDADLGEGVEPIIGLLDYECLPGKAVVLSLSVGALEDVVV